MRKRSDASGDHKRRDAVRITCSVAAIMLAGTAIPGCSGPAPESATDTVPAHGLVWAVNVGGADYVGLDGTAYAAEASVTGGATGSMDVVKGSQDAALYRTYREGDIEIARPLANGSYDLTFHFAEPRDHQTGDRVFAAFAEGERVVDELDVMLFRDGQAVSALTVTVPDVDVRDGELNVTFEASAGEPTLSAFAVRSKVPASNNWKLV